ncbi:MAG: hypothetical protein G8345_13040 [Magnetococcales bacterium]|nr:hypothetical protein [Magnetococcales bacterium]NGZ27798.1 hypothetical protein [Magnetococcales bacterium]
MEIPSRVPWKFLIYTSAEFPDLIIDGVVFLPTTLQKRNPQIQAIIRGWNRALDVAKKNSDVAYAAIARYQNSDVNLMSIISKGMEIGDTQVDLRQVLGVSGTPGTGVDAARQVSAFLLRFNLIKVAPDPLDFFVPLATSH